MANTRITSSFITREMMRVLHSNLKVVKSIDHSWNKLFGKSIGPVGKSGATVNIRKPALGSIRTGWAMDQSDVTETYVPLTIDTAAGVDLNFSDADMALSVEDFSERYIVPNGLKLASYVDMIAAQTMKNKIANTVAVSSLGTAPNALSYFLSAGQKIKENLCPMDSSLSAIISPRTEGAMVGALAGQYNPAGNISEMYEKGQMSKAAGFDWYMSQILPAHTHGTCTAGTTPAVTGYTSNTLTISNMTNGGTLTAGDVLTVSTCYAVNPETKQTYSSLQQFVVTATTTASGTDITVSVSPDIIISGANQTVSATPVGGTAVLAQTTANQIVQTDLVLHKDSFAIAFADLAVPQGMDMASTLSADGISLRFVRGFDIKGGGFLSRLDVFFGIAATRQEWACKIIS
jgi:hypothetical protein